MSKIIRINNCLDCPYCHFYEYESKEYAVCELPEIKADNDIFIGKILAIGKSFWDLQKLPIAIPSECTLEND